jgi:hypothetical protein
VYEFPGYLWCFVCVILYLIKIIVGFYVLDLCSRGWIPELAMVLKP